MRTREEVEKAFSPVELTPYQRSLVEWVNNLFSDTALELITIIPPSPEATLSCRSLQEAKMWANTAVAQSDLTEFDRIFSKSK